MLKDISSKYTPLYNQPTPKKNLNIPIVGLVMKDLTDRMIRGVETYGVPLQANNGRDALQDLYEELLDACCYLKQHMEERDKLQRFGDS